MVNKSHGRDGELHENMRNIRTSSTECWAGTPLPNESYTLYRAPRGEWRAHHRDRSIGGERSRWTPPFFAQRGKVSPACFARMHTPSTVMELRASTQCSAASKACLVAGRYAGVTISEVVDENAQVVVLLLGNAPADGDVEGADAVLR